MEGDKRVKEAIARLLDDAQRVERAKAEQRPLVYILGSNNNVQIGASALPPVQRTSQEEAG